MREDGEKEVVSSVFEMIVRVPVEQPGGRRGLKLGAGRRWGTFLLAPFGGAIQSACGTHKFSLPPPQHSTPPPHRTPHTHTPGHSLGLSFKWGADGVRRWREKWENENDRSVKEPLNKALKPEPLVPSSGRCL